MKRLALLSLLLCSLALLACKPTLDGSGVQVVMPLELIGFEQVKASQAFRLEITRSEAFSVQVHIDDNLAEHLRVRVVRDCLEIGMNPEYNYRTGKQSMLAKISLPRLTGVRLSGASRASLIGFSGSDPLDVKLSGASRLSGQVTAGAVSLDLSDASELELTGAAGHARLELSGASDAELSAWKLASAKADLSGASKATVQVAGRLDVEASGASNLTYVGQPDLGKVETSGASSVRAR